MSRNLLLTAAAVTALFASPVLAQEAPAIQETPPAEATSPDPITEAPSAESQEASPADPAPEAQGSEIPDPWASPLPESVTEPEAPAQDAILPPAPEPTTEAGDSEEGEETTPPIAN